MRWTILILLLLIYLNTIAQNEVAFLKTPTKYISASISSEYGFTEIPIQIKNEKILIEATIEGDSGYLILDTGAPGIIINQVVAASEGATAFSVSREFSVQETSVSYMQWGEIEEYSKPALAVDLSHLEEVLDQRILGMIGFDVLKNYLLVIDYPAQKLMVSPLGQNQELRNWAPKFSLPFELDYHLPVVEVVIGGKKLRMGIDTGTGSNLIDAQLVNTHLNDHFTETDKARLRGLDQQLELVPSGKIDKMTVSDYTISDADFMLTDLTALRDATGLEIDGLLGYDFFKDYRCALDFASHRIYFW